MEVTVTSVSGIGTANAVIKAAHTRQNARSYCTDYVQNNSKKCIDDALRETRLSDQITGNCKTGTFTTFNGGKYRFAGLANASDDVSGSYRIFEDGKILDGSSASGYPVAIETFRALCPTGNQRILVSKLDQLDRMRVGFRAIAAARSN